MDNGLFFMPILKPKTTQFNEHVEFQFEIMIRLYKMAFNHTKQGLNIMFKKITLVSVLLITSSVLMGMDRPTGDDDKNPTLLANLPSDMVGAIVFQIINDNEPLPAVIMLAKIANTSRKNKEIMMTYLKANAQQVIDALNKKTDSLMISVLLLRHFELLTPEVGDLISAEFYRKGESWYLYEVNRYLVDLGRAIDENNLEDVKKYINLGVNINSPKMHLNPLVRTITNLRMLQEDEKMNKLLAIIRYLLKDPRIDVNNLIGGKTALDYAKKVTGKYHDELISLLKAAGAKHAKELSSSSNNK